MAFDRENFFKSCGHYGRGSAIADGFEALHAELAELKAACLGLKDRMEALEARTGKPEDAPEPARETGWVVSVSSMNRCLAVEQTGKAWCLPLHKENRGAIRQFEERQDAQNLCRLLGIGKPLLVYKDTLEEVPGDA